MLLGGGLGVFSCHLYFRQDRVFEKGVGFMPFKISYDRKRHVAARYSSCSSNEASSLKTARSSSTQEAWYIEACCLSLSVVLLMWQAEKAISALNRIVLLRARSGMIIWNIFWASLRSYHGAKVSI
jgi:hypothetical protein